MFSSFGSGNAPKGFPGPNDHWHLHRNVCFSVGAAGISVPFAPDRDVTQAECAAAHGTFLKKTTWMVHAWVVPGWESPHGVFAHANPDLRCADGTMHTDKVGFCKGHLITPASAQCRAGRARRPRSGTPKGGRRPGR